MGGSGGLGCGKGGGGEYRGGAPVSGPETNLESIDRALAVREEELDQSKSTRPGPMGVESKSLPRNGGSTTIAADANTGLRAAVMVWTEPHRCRHEPVEA